MAQHNFTHPNLVEDDEFDAPEAKPTTRSGNKSIYDQLRDELASPPVFEEHATLKVPGKQGLELKVSTKLPLSALQRLQAGAYNKKQKSTDLSELYAGLIARQTVCFVLGGKDAVDDDGDLVNFRHAGTQESLNALDIRGAVKVLIPRDSDLVALGGEIMDVCGYGDREDDRADDEDPLGLEND